MGRTVFTWMIIFSLLFILWDIYNFMDDRYLDLGEDAPLPSELHPVVEENKKILLEQAAAIDIDVVITSKTRTLEEQNELYAKGRSKEGNIVTNAKGGESYHNYGLAIDYALRLDNGEVIWDIEYDENGNGIADWLEVAELAKNLGFEWVGDWENFPDYPHLQMDFGLSIQQLQAGLRPAYDEDRREALEGNRAD
jgi:peptidoglycan L-alanyl-D-glutamate endopeptidase CwlK